MAWIPPGGHQDPPPPPQAPLEAVAQPRQMEEPAPEGRHRWFPQIQGRGHGGYHRHQGLGVPFQDGDRRQLAPLSQPVKLRSQQGEARGAEGRIHH